MTPAAHVAAYVADASVAVKWYVPESHSADAERLLVAGAELHAPDLIQPEFGSILWKKVRRGEVTEKKARDILAAFLAVPLLKHPGAGLLEPAFDAALLTGQTVYDCTYLALAVALGCQMVTADEKFYRALAATPLAANLLWVGDVP
jgi:predicted nucleic acid-binding protein